MPKLDGNVEWWTSTEDGKVVLSYRVWQEDPYANWPELPVGMWPEIHRTVIGVVKP